MTQLNLDKVIQDKLQGLNCDYQPEFWDDMERKINASPLSGAGTSAATSASSISSTTIISAISILLISIGAISYFAFNNNEENISEQISETTIVENVVAQQNDSKDIINSINSEDIVISDNSTDNNSNIASINSNNSLNKSKNYNGNNSSYKNTIISTPIIEEPLNNEVTNAKTQVSNTECNKLDIYNYEVDLLNDSDIPEELEDDNIKMYNLEKKSDIKYERKTIEKEIKEEKIGTEKRDNSELKKVKPMPKPAKRVFGKKRGILYRLGLRK